MLSFIVTGSDFVADGVTSFLLRVSGVTMLEKKYAENSEFASFASRTSAFFPLSPKNL